MNTLYRNRYICLSILMTLVVYSLSAQDSNLVPRRLYIEAPGSTYLEGLEIEAESSARREEALQRYLLTAVAESTEVVLVEREEDADCSLSVMINYGEEGARVRFRLYDAFFDSELVMWETALSRFSLKELRVSMESEGLSLVQQHLPPRDPEIVEVVTEKVVEEVEVQKVYVDAEGVELTISGGPGTRLVTTTGENYQIDEEGFIILDLPADSYFEFKASRDGYFPDTVGVVVEKQPVMVEVELMKAARWGIDTGFVLYDFALSPAIQFFYKPNYGYINFRVTQNFISLVTLLTAIGTFPHPSLFFMEPAVGTGWYFFSPSSPVRLGIAAEISMRIVFPDVVAPYLSRIKPLALTFSGMLDFSPFKKVRFYGGWHPTLFYQFSTPPLYDTDRYIPGLEGLRLFAGLHLNLVSFTMGVRVLL